MAADMMGMLIAFSIACGLVVLLIAAIAPQPKKRKRRKKPDADE
ncbi:MAG: hypothetical protein QE290_10615 [Acidovorax sp.]|nr:hypothetical protein [Acidovorax sp.]MDH4464475.1 hypothetical protein [Acidovorax sp.]